MPYEFYKVMHFVGLFMLFSALGCYFQSAAAGAGRAFPGRKLAGLTHGVGLLLVFVAGFGLIARLQIPTPWPVWIYLKMAIWLLLGGMIALVPRFPVWGRALWLLAVVLGGVGAYLARVKPF